MMTAPTFIVSPLQLDAQRRWSSGSVLIDGVVCRLVALVFENPSVHGWNGGRTSKLWLKDEASGRVFEFERNGYILLNDFRFENEDINRLVAAVEAAVS